MDSSTIAAAPRAHAEADEKQTNEEVLPRISRAEFWTIWALAVGLFLLWAGPIWRHPWDIDLVNRAIFWSYLPIPVLVVACLVRARRFSLRAFFLDALELTLLKYACTFTFALVLWEVVPLPAVVHSMPIEPAHAAAAGEPTITPTLIDPADTGIVDVSVTDTAGRPIEGATVYVSAGLEAYVFAPPSEPITLVNSGGGIRPEMAVAQVGQILLVRSGDGQLHTLVAGKEGATLFNVPLLSSGEPSRVRVREAAGIVSTRCNVHSRSAEHEGSLLLLEHPFFALSDAGGRARLEGVPAGSIRVAAWHHGQPESEARVDVAPREKSAVQLVIDH